MAHMGVTKPAAGVMATSPATAPEAAPRVVALPPCSHSAAIQDRAAAAVAMWVVTKALAASPSAARADPALKPNQPNQRMAAPRMVMGRLWGMKAVEPCPLRLPMSRAQHRAAAPELMWTTAPPAKSRAPIWPIQPPPQTQWHMGA